MRTRTITIMAIVSLLLLIAELSGGGAEAACGEV